MGGNSRRGPEPIWYCRVLLLNVQANAWVALVLAVAACYEAVEVIWMAG